MAAESLTEQVVEEAFIATTRRIDGRVIGSLGIGLGIGIAVGFYIGYKYSKKKLRAEILEEAEKEIKEVRELYRQKTIAAEAQEKPPVSEIVRDRGYSQEEDSEQHERLLRPPVPVDPPRSYHTAQTPRASQPSFDPSELRTDAASKDKNEDWDYEREIANRDDDKPYIIHQDEFETNELGYSQTSYIYFSGDNVLVDSDDPRTILMNSGNLVGYQALTHFGHGSDDYNVVYIRNPRLEIEFEIFRTRGSWEQEVSGLDANEPT